MSQRKRSISWLTWTLTVVGPIGVGLGLSGGCGAATKSDAPTSAEASTKSPSSAYEALFSEAWTAAGISANVIDDDTFLRRVTLDLYGRIPSKEELLAFRGDSQADKRARLVDTMLDHPEHAAHLARAWEQTLLGPEVRLRLVDRGAMRRWLEERFAKDVPWDVIVRDLIAAEGASSAGGSMRDALTQTDEAMLKEERDENVNGATNYSLRFRKNPQDLAGNVSRTFLGVQIQCAQCHDSKTDVWTQTQFREFASPFLFARAKPVGKTKGEMAIFELESSDRPNRKALRIEELAAIAETPPRALDGTPLATDDPRKALAAWITSKDNKWFAKAMINRVWADLHGQGFIDPVDDMREGSEVVLPAVFELLADDFEKSGFDLDWLYRTIILGPTYRTTIDGTMTPRATQFSTMDLMPMSSHTLLDSVFIASDADARLVRVAPANARALKNALRLRMEFVFDGDAESNSAAQATTLSQALFLANSAFMTAATSHSEGSMLQQLVHSGGDDATIVRELFQRTLTRDPTDEEVAAMRALLDEKRTPAELAIQAPRGEGKARRIARMDEILLRATKPKEGTERARAVEDLFWALLNSNEFLFRK